MSVAIDISLSSEEAQRELEERLLVEEVRERELRKLLRIASKARTEMAIIEDVIDFSDVWFEYYDRERPELVEEVAGGGKD